MKLTIKEPRDYENNKDVPFRFSLQFNLPQAVGVLEYSKLAPGVYDIEWIKSRIEWLDERATVSEKLSVIFGNKIIPATIVKSRGGGYEVWLVGKPISAMMLQRGKHYTHKYSSQVMGEFWADKDRDNDSGIGYYINWSEDEGQSIPTSLEKDQC